VALRTTGKEPLLKEKKKTVTGVRKGRFLEARVGLEDRRKKVVRGRV